MDIHCENISYPGTQTAGICIYTFHVEVFWIIQLYWICSVKG